ncbi:MAG: cupin domain-containing protein [Burkholderiales bacterium]|nr:cupin domain-containing protein [Burkholderiales bacterium]
MLTIARTQFPVLFAILGLLAAFAAGPARGDENHDGLKITPKLAQELADLPGKEGLMITVEFPPGYVSEPHRHEAHTFVYVLEGRIEMQVEGGPVVTLKPGDTFYENPQDVHTVARNASKTKPAKFLVLLVKNKGVPPVLPAQK